MCDGDSDMYTVADSGCDARRTMNKPPQPNTNSTTTPTKIQTERGIRSGLGDGNPRGGRAWMTWISCDVSSTLKGFPHCGQLTTLPTNLSGTCKWLPHMGHIVRLVMGASAPAAGAGAFWLNPPGRGVEDACWS